MTGYALHRIPSGSPEHSSERQEIKGSHPRAGFLESKWGTLVSPSGTKFST